MAATNTVATPNNISVMFDLDDAHKEAIGPRTRGRQATPSAYTEHFKVALAAGGEKGIRLSATLKAPYVLAQLRKAAKQYNAALKPDSKQVAELATFDRHDHVTLPPFVGFTVKLVDRPVETPAQ